MGFECFAIQGEACGFEFPPDDGSLPCAGDWVYREILCQPLLPASMFCCFWFCLFLFTQCVGVAQVFLRFLPQELVPYVAVDSVYL